MALVHRTDEFDKWLKGLPDQRGKAKILVRIERLEAGNPGDVRPVGEGVSELRIPFGPGYRVYYRRRSDQIYLLCGGDKDSQNTDVKKAMTLARKLGDPKP
jgi:putative addiction module killer protein